LIGGTSAYCQTAYLLLFFRYFVRTDQGSALLLYGKRDFLGGGVLFAYRPNSCSFYFVLTTPTNLKCVGNQTMHSNLFWGMGAAHG